MGTGVDRSGRPCVLEGKGVGGAVGDGKDSAGVGLGPAAAAGVTNRAAARVSVVAVIHRVLLLKEGRFLGVLVTQRVALVRQFDKQAGYSGT